MPVTSKCGAMAQSLLGPVSNFRCADVHKYSDNMIFSSLLVDILRYICIASEAVPSSLSRVFFQKTRV